MGVNIRRRCGSHACQNVDQAELPGFPQSGDCGYHRFGECLPMGTANLTAGLEFRGPLIPKVLATSATGQSDSY